MDCTFDEVEGVLMVNLVGRFVAACVEDVREQVVKRMEHCPNVVFNLEKMEHIDSSGLGLLVQMLQHATVAGGKVKLAAIQPHPRIVFDITKVYRVFDIFDTADEAIASFKQ